MQLIKNYGLQYFATNLSLCQKFNRLSCHPKKLEIEDQIMSNVSRWEEKINKNKIKVKKKERIEKVMKPKAVSLK